jgi:thiamine biosynthesis protein ThiS
VIISLNGAKCEVADGTTIDDLLISVTGADRGSAAVVDGEIVPRSTWSITVLQEGQAVELITAVQGG